MVKKKKRMIPSTHPAHKMNQVDSKNKDMGQSYMIKAKVINNLKLGKGMGNGKLEMGIGNWEMGNGKWEMGNGKWEM